MFVNLTTTVRLGEIFLIVFHLLLSVTEIDSKSNIRNQISAFKPEGSTMKDDLTPGVVIMNDKATLKRFLKRTPRKKRNFVNMVKKCCNLSINTTTSTCTPFFIRRSKMAHRKTIRLKKPMHLSTMQTDLSANEPLLQKQEKGKIKKLLFAKHSSTSSFSFVTDSSELQTGKNKNHYDRTTNTLNLLGPSSEKIIINKSGTMGVGTDGFNITVNENIITFDRSLSTKYKLTTSGMKTDLPISETTSNYTTLESFEAGSNVDGNLRTQVNHIKGSTVSLTDLSNKTTNPFNASESKANVILKKLHLKDIFHFKKASSFAPSEPDRITSTFESGKVLQYYSTLAVTHSISNMTTENDTVGQRVTNSNEFTSFLPKDTSQLKNIFHIHHKQRDFYTHYFTGKPKKFNSAEPIMEQTTDILETQIPSSLSKHKMNKAENKSESNLSTIASPGITSSENERKYMHFRNMLHRQQRTTLDKVTDPTELEKDITLKSNSFDSNFVSGTNFTSLTSQSESESKTDSYSRENKNIMPRLFNFKKHKEGRGNNHLMFEITVSKENEVLDQSSIETTVNQSIETIDGKTNPYDNSDNKQENSKITTVHNPFKIKYLMKFRSPTSSTQSDYNNSSWLSLTSSKTYNDKKGLPFNKEHFSPVETTTEPMDTQDNLSTDLRASNQLDYCPIQQKLHKKHHILTKTSLQNTFNIRGQNITDTVKLESDANTLSTLQLKETKDSLKFKDNIGLRKYKTHGKNKNRKHNTRIPINPGVRVSRKQVCCYKLGTEDDFKGRFNVTVYRDNSRQFRDWFFGKTTRPAINKGHKNEEECTFRWCFEPRFNKSRSLTTSSLLSTWPLNNTPEAPTIRGQKHTETFSKFPPEKNFKNFFHFKTSHIPIPEYNTTVESVSDVMKELANYTNTKLIPLNETTTKYYEKNHPLDSNSIVSHTYSSRSSVKPVPFELTSVMNTTKNLHSLEIVTLKSDLNSTDTIKPKGYGRGKVKQFFNRFHAAKIHSSNNTFNLNNKENISLIKENGTVILNQEYADYIETKVETKKHKKHSNRTVSHNASDVNDTSFNVMAYVMKPFDSLVSVFKALSPNSVTKIGDVNATDIKNGSLPNHLQPPNSSIVILAVNNTNATSRDVHESKLAMALDLLGGMYHCVFKSFFEAKPEDVHFYLYTRSSPEEPEELFLPPEPADETVTDNADLPQPVLEKKMTTESSPLDKREVEDDEDDYEDYEFEALNPAKSEIQSKWFNVRAETKVLIHGYLQDYQTDIMVSMREAFLSRGPYNVVVVDWSVLVGDSSCYPVVASRGLRQVGGLLAQLLNRLVEAGVSPSTIHIVGFSLGAHVAGHAGTFLSHGLISRITGLDPALPYVPMEPDMSLNSDDAVFVDIIHSAAGLLGQSGPMGHVDFYPNGGSQQPGCEVSSLSCSHRRAALYFIESINSDSGFKATKCESWHHFQADNCSYPTKVLMGAPCPTNTSGKYYLATGYRSPFALQPEEHIQVKKSLLLDLFYDSEDL